MKTCDMYTGEYSLITNIYRCGKKAKWKNPEKKHPRFLCGIHKNSLNKMFKRIDSNLKCELIATPQPKDTTP